MRRKIAAIMIAIGLSVAAVTALANVTFVMTNGDRHAGTLANKGTGDIGLVTGGQERMFPISDVAVIIYNDGDPREGELSLSSPQPTIHRTSSVIRSSCATGA